MREKGSEPCEVVSHRKSPSCHFPFRLETLRGQPGLCSSWYPCFPGAQDSAGHSAGPKVLGDRKGGEEQDEAQRDLLCRHRVRTEAEEKIGNSWAVRGEGSRKDERCKMVTL